MFMKRKEKSVCTSLNVKESEHRAPTYQYASLNVEEKSRIGTVENVSLILNDKEMYPDDTALSCNEYFTEGCGCTLS